MHAIFLLYGMIHKVDFFLNELFAQKADFVFYNKETGERKIHVTNCQIRTFGGGIFYDFVFPKEFADIFLTSLNFHKKAGIYDLDLETR